MCGRFTITSEKELIIKRFHASLDEPLEPRYNAAPSDRLPVILNVAPEKVRLLQWGLKPEWLKKIGKRDGLINIRAETLRDRPTFKGDLKNRRCLVLADSFYEWQKNESGEKQPYRLMLKSGEPFAFAGLWEENLDEQGQPLLTFAIITTEPNELIAPIHNRMPVILARNAERKWLDLKIAPEKTLEALRPYAAKSMLAYPVSSRVNDPSLDDESLILQA